MEKRNRKIKKTVRIKRQKKKRKIKRTVKIKTQKKKHKIINVKDIQKKYKRKEVVCFTWTEKAGYHALSTAKVRSRLQHLMGTDVIRINDKRYIDKMFEKLEIEQEAEVCKKEQALEDAEDERLRSLQLSGVLPKPKQTPLQVKQKRDHMKLSEHKKNKNKQVEEINEESVILTEEETSDNRINKEVKYNQCAYTKKENQNRTSERTPTGKFAQKETPFVKALRGTQGQNTDPIVYLPLHI
ncbi:Hypothetical predicted protein [Mytilus galloprovincialis]|uniref:Uncharacterized protein n=1 Tax=Mytilus galloprovincialis TaxID=29158 RepID=A0A8B6F1M7_MYTGA|nr:Hypothetical predicted protein [Mytilus galloprovincialis]